MYPRSSPRLFIPRGDNAFPLCIKWASLAFLTASQLLLLSSSGMRWTPLIECPGLLKCRETGAGSLSWWWLKMVLRCSLNFSLSWRLVSLMYLHLQLLHWMEWLRFLDLQDKLSVSFLCSLPSSHSRYAIEWTNHNSKQIQIADRQMQGREIACEHITNADCFTK